MKARDAVLVAIGLFVLAGCAITPKGSSAPKATQTVDTPKLTYWEYRELSGFGAERSPEAEKLKQDGWTYMGNTDQGGGLAVFRRAYKGIASSPPTAPSP